MNATAHIWHNQHENFIRDAIKILLTGISYISKQKLMPVLPLPSLFSW